jgi:hypothetical protein
MTAMLRSRDIAASKSSFKTSASPPRGIGRCGASLRSAIMGGPYFGRTADTDGVGR